MDKEKYLRSLYSYLPQHNYCILKIEERYSHILTAIPLDNSNYFNEKGHVKVYGNSKFYSEDAFIEYTLKKRTSIDSLSNDKILFDHFIKLFKDGDKELKANLLKNIEDYIDRTWEKNFTYIFDNIISSPKEAIGYLHAIPISVWSIHKIELDELDNFLLNKGVNGKEYDNFYVKFLKARKNQINNPTFGPKVKDFLIKKYGFDEEKLSPYIPFFNYIKEIYEKIDLDIYEDIPQNVVVSRVNYRKATKLLCIPGYHDTLIKRTINDFMRLIQAHKGIKQLYMEDVGPGIMEIRCFTDNQLTQKDINDEIRDYLLFKKSNKDIPTDKLNVEKYLMNKELQSELSKNQPVAKKMKL